MDQGFDNPSSRPLSPVLAVHDHTNISNSELTGIWSQLTSSNQLAFVPQAINGLLPYPMR